jgi:hypothetical protein
MRKETILNQFTWTRFAALITAAALVALTVVATSSADNQAKGSKPTHRPVIVKTVVVHRTVRVTRHQKSKHAASGPKPPVVSEVKPARGAKSSSSTAPARKPAAVYSQTSGAGNGGGDDDDKHDDESDDSQSSEDEDGRDEHESDDDSSEADDD